MYPQAGTNAASSPSIIDQSGAPGTYVATFTALMEDTLRVTLLVSGEPAEQGVAELEVLFVPGTEAAFFALALTGGTLTVGETIVFLIEQVVTITDMAEADLQIMLLRPGRQQTVMSPFIEPAAQNAQVCVPRCLSHCVSPTVSLPLCLSHGVSPTVSLPLCLSHGVSPTVYLPLCLSHCASPTVCLSHSVSHCVSHSVSHCVSH
jgi:hypothetical protein